MGRYIDWNDLVSRYPKLSTKGGAGAVDSSFIQAVEYQLDGMLTGIFAIPFSDNNVTIKDLCIELCNVRMTSDYVKHGEKMKKTLMDRIERIRNGYEAMMTNSGDVMYASGDVIFSTTENRGSLFDVGTCSANVNSYMCL